MSKEQPIEATRRVALRRNCYGKLGDGSGLAKAGQGRKRETMLIIDGEKTVGLCLRETA